MFESSDEVYEHLGKLFQGLAVDPEGVAELRKVDAVLQVRCTEPDALITVRVTEGQEAVVDRGQTNLHPEVVIALTADNAHRLFLGKLNVTEALASGEIQVKGPVTKVLRLVLLTRTASEKYRAALEAAGREDLAAV